MAKAGYYKLRCSLESGGTIKSRIFTRDCIFDSLSAASSVVLGRCSNGKKEWKTINLVRETVRTIEIDSRGKPVFKGDSPVKRLRRRIDSKKVV